MKEASAASLKVPRPFPIPEAGGIAGGKVALVSCFLPCQPACY
ncbi:hypothetical protein Brsp01_41680 [Brucella sp. NBRC 12950]|nr:hypothetical protein Brsp01_41680 [Brucella sp. NBRC 12950]